MGRQIVLKKYLEACEEIEAVASQIYHFHADCFAENKEISRLWRKTAFEEETDALTIDMAKKSVAEPSDPQLTSSRAESTKNMIHALFEAIKRSPPSLEEAIHTAIECEELLAQFHMDQAISFDDRTGADLFKELMVQNLRHIEDLECVLRDIVGTGKE